MQQADPTHPKRDAEFTHISGGNDNDEPPVNAVAFTDLASAMGMDEDALLQRFAAILRKREGGEDTTPAEE
jgi:hypothetical protein